MTQKGIKRAKGLCKSVGLLVNLEVDLERPNKNKVTINMYDKDLMPVVEDLYLHDQSMSVLMMKREGKDDEQNEIFDEYACKIEEEIMAIAGVQKQNKAQGGSNKNGDRTNDRINQYKMEASKMFPDGFGMDDEEDIIQYDDEFE